MTMTAFDEDLAPDLKRAREDKMAELRSAARASKDARKRYTAAIVSAADFGLSNTMIGSIIGITEAAVRLHLKRHGYRR